MGLTKIEAVEIPGTVTEIEDGAFDEGITIIAPAGSYAIRWADNNGYKYLTK